MDLSNKDALKSIAAILLVAMMILSMVMTSTVHVRAATEAEIEQAIEDGLAWLVAQQNSNPADPNFGSWNAYYGQLEAGTGLALYKLCDRAYELDYSSPFDTDYEYHQNVIHGFGWVFDHLAVVDIGLQDHTTGATGTVDDPDTYVNGKGVCTLNWYSSYTTGILLAAISASGTPNRVVNDPSSPVNGWTYGQVAQDMVDFLAFSQVDPSTGYGGILEGGWDYTPVNNGTGGTGWQGDQSNSGYAVLGLGEAQAFGCTIPDWVKTELNWWIDWVQDDFNGDTNDGGSWYSYPGDWLGVNILKTGNLIFEMALVGDTPTTQRVTNATDYLVRHWNDASGIDQPPGWNGTPAQYQAMFCAMKGLEYMGVDTFDSIDWFEGFSDVIVAQQDKTPGPTYGSWQSSSGRGEPVIITEWALLTLEKVAPPPIDRPKYFELWVTERISTSPNIAFYVNYTVDEDGNQETIDPVLPWTTRQLEYNRTECEYNVFRYETTFATGSYIYWQFFISNSLTWTSEICGPELIEQEGMLNKENVFTINGHKYDYRDGAGLEGWTIKLYRDNVEIDETQTGPDGSYQLIGAGMGSFEVCEIAKYDEGWANATPGRYEFRVDNSCDGDRTFDFYNYKMLRISDTSDCRRELSSFGVVFTPDGNSGKYKLSSTNPGSFYTAVVKYGTPDTHVRVEINLPPDQENAEFDSPNFILHHAQRGRGARKHVVDIHVYAGRLDDSPCGSEWVPDWSTDITKSFDITATADGKNATVEGIMPSTGEVYVTVHIDYQISASLTWDQVQMFSDFQYTFGDTVYFSAQGVRYGFPVK